jgi:hypothetical protein
VIESDDVPSVGGRIQAAFASARGVELKAVLLVAPGGGQAFGGFMGWKWARSAP